MNVIGIVGYKNSGKSSLVLKLAEKLSDSYTVGIIKHAGEFNEKESDTRKFSTLYQTGFISPEKSGIFFPEEKTLEEILSYLHVDIVLVEGFKENRSFPKITCGEYDDDLAIGSDQEDIDALIEKIENYGFKLPNENCGQCGYTCEEMASRIIRGETSPGECQQLTDTEIRVNGKPIPLNRFVSNLVKNVVTGVVDSLSGTEKGTIEITVKE